MWFTCIFKIQKTSQPIKRLTMFLYLLTTVGFHKMLNLHLAKAFRITFIPFTVTFYSTIMLCKKTAPNSVPRILCQESTSSHDLFTVILVHQQPRRILPKNLLRLWLMSLIFEYNIIWSLKRMLSDTVKYGKSILPIYRSGVIFSYNSSWWLEILAGFSAVESILARFYEKFSPVR